jgi:tetratricopeptide (TPR) repeat protein/tRNA A-37 threonylcarbamoyl transferase component Bud32
MIDRTPNPSCVKCGYAVPQGAGFCPNCGTQIHDLTFDASAPPNQETILPTVPASANAGGNTTPAGAPVSATGHAPTIGPTGIETSLANPSPRPAVHAGDGPFQPGQQINPRYTILKLLGTGGMGAVYQAFDHELGVAVAIKVIRPSAQSDATAAKELEQRFKRELVLARQVTHKYVVRIHDLGEIDGIKYLTMPFVEGETLSHILRRSGALPQARVIKIAQQVAQGLAAAHEKGVVHRDLKPENIMIERVTDDPVPLAGDALIMDFGIARSVAAGATQTAAGSVIGTLEYMAPEQAQGQKVDQRADQYAFGLIVYDMLVGRQRLSSGDGPMAELLQRIAVAPPAPRTINPEVPEALNDIVMRCLHPQPAARYPTTQDLVNALDHLTPDGHIRSDVHEVIVTRSRPAWQLAAAAAVIIALAGTAGWVVSNRSGGGLPTASDVREPISVLIGDFDNRTGDPVFDGVVEQALGLGIEGASFVNAFPRRDALRAAAAIKPGARLDEPIARLVALRESLGMVIVGAIEPRGSGYHITIKGVGPGDDAAVKYTLEDDAASKADVLQTVGALAAQVRVALGDTVAPAANDAFTAASLEAAREYVRAQELQVAGNGNAAITAYLEAVRLDPDFGRAYAGAATQANNLGRREEAAKYYDEALARIDRMTEREKFRTRGQYYLFSRNAPKAVEELSALVERYPSDGVGLGNLSFAYQQLREFDKAMEIGIRAAALHPNNVIRQNNVALYAMYAGKFEEAIARGKRAAEINQTYALAWLTQGLGAVALGKFDDALAAYATMAALPGWKAVAAQGTADLALLRGRVRDAAAALEPLLNEKLPPAQFARLRTTLASVRLSQGRTAEAIKLAEAALAASPDPTTRFEAGRILLAGGNSARAKALAADLDKALLPETQALAATLQGEMHLASRDARDAIAALQGSLKLADAWQTRYLLGRAYLDAGAFAEADSEFDACLRRRGEATAVHLDDVPTWRVIAPVYYYQGVTRAAMKNGNGAEEAFRTFLAFKDGGDEQSALVADARKRLAQ